LAITGGTAALTNTIVAGNFAVADADFLGTVASSDHDLIGSTAGSSGFSTAHGDLLDVQPNLAALGNYGGITQTMPLLPGSLGIDVGDSAAWKAGVAPGPAVDQRGFRRVIGASVDIGATEYQYDLAVQASAPPTVAVNGQIAYTMTVTNNGPDPVSGAAITFALPRGTTLNSLLVPDLWNYSASVVGGIVYYTFTDTTPLNPGASASFSLVAQLGPTVKSGTTLTSRITAAPTADDDAPSNNSVTLSTKVQ
jgi:uncharacterized repeat protein (TIGR01451 family)